MGITVKAPYRRKPRNPDRTLMAAIVDAYERDKAVWRRDNDVALEYYAELTDEKLVSI
jgi:hypothetical protein